MNLGDRRQAFWLVLLGALGITALRVIWLRQQQLELFVDEAQYWYWAQSPAWGYFSKPPLIAWLIAATTRVCGDGELCVKASSFLLYPLSTLGFFFVGARLYDARVGAIAALGFLLLPGIDISALIVSTDVPLLCCWIWALYCLLRALDEDAWRWWLAMGTLVGLGLLAKYPMVFFFLGALPLCWRRLLQSPKPWVAALLALAIFAPHLLWNLHSGMVTVHHTVSIAQWDRGALLRPEALLDFIGEQLAIIGPLLGLLGLLLLRPRLPLDEPARARRRLLAWFSLPLLALMTAQALLAKANGNWAALAFVGIVLFIVGEALREQRSVWLAAAIALNVLLGLLAYNYHALAGAFGVELTRRNDPYVRIMGWRQAAAQIREVWREYPQAQLLAEERDVLAELAYYLRPEGTAIQSLTLPGAPRHHYDLVAPAGDAACWLYVARRGDALQTLAGRVAQAQRLAPIHVPLRRDAALDLQLVLITRDGDLQACRS